MSVRLILAVTLIALVCVNVTASAQQQPGTASASAPKAPEPTPRVVAAPAPDPVVSDDTAVVTIGHIHNVFERQGNVFRVSQTLRLAAAKGSFFKSPAGYPIPVPAHARAPRVHDENKHLYKVTGHSIYYLPPIVQEGREVRIGFDIPIKGGRAELDQKFGGAIASVQMISTWTAGETSFSGTGFDEPQLRELNSGIHAIVMNASTIEDGRLQIVASGLGAIRGVVLRWFTLLGAMGLFVAGVVIWFRRKRAAAL